MTNQVRNSTAIDDLLVTRANPLCHYSSTYLEFLQASLPGASIQVLEHYTNGMLDGFLPYAIKRHQRFGTVINSLPFFGSHGGPFSIEVSSSVRKDLMREFAELVVLEDASSSTIVENPFQPLTDEEIAVSGHSIVDDRIGQFTEIPSMNSDMEAAFFRSFHVKTRNAIRKGQRLSLHIENREDEHAWEWMHKEHHASINAMGGVPKSTAIFQSLRLAFGDRVSLHTGSLSGQPICGVVTIRYRDTIEYFTPVIVEEWRESQALSALIFELMVKAAQNGCRLWNWGGTWRSQQGVYRFKNRWGAHDAPYRYFNWLRKPELKDIPREELQEEFPHFYLFRYST